VGGKKKNAKEGEKNPLVQTLKGYPKFTGTMGHGRSESPEKSPRAYLTKREVYPFHGRLHEERSEKTRETKQESSHKVSPGRKVGLRIFRGIIKRVVVKAPGAGSD